jgi:branched-chain amino acid transport system ATP-binding protein
MFKVSDQLRKQVSIVIVEHNLDLVLALADRVFALERGTVFHQGADRPRLLQANPLALADLFATEI